jgi:hypothetical protein
VIFLDNFSFAKFQPGDASKVLLIQPACLQMQGIFFPQGSDPLWRVGTFGCGQRPSGGSRGAEGNCNAPFLCVNTQYFKILRGFDLSLQRYAAIVVESE